VRICERRLKRNCATQVRFGVRSLALIAQYHAQQVVRGGVSLVAGERAPQDSDRFILLAELEVNLAEERGRRPIPGVGVHDPCAERLCAHQLPAVERFPGVPQQATSAQIREDHAARLPTKNGGYFRENRQNHAIPAIPPAKQAASSAHAPACAQGPSTAGFHETSGCQSLGARGAGAGPAYWALAVSAARGAKGTGGSPT